MYEWDGRVSDEEPCKKADMLDLEHKWGSFCKQAYRSNRSLGDSIDSFVEVLIYGVKNLLKISASPKKESVASYSIALGKTTGVKGLEDIIINMNYVNGTFNWQVVDFETKGNRFKVKGKYPMENISVETTPQKVFDVLFPAIKRAVKKGLDTVGTELMYPMA